MDKGENILAQSTAVALVVDSAEAVVEIDIPEQDISYISKGCPAKLKLDSYPGEIFTGEVSKVSEVLDVASRTLDIEIALANPENRLKSGMFARIDILAGKRQGPWPCPRMPCPRKTAVIMPMWWRMVRPARSRWRSGSLTIKWKYLRD